jgi:hypothetical protein
MICKSIWDELCVSGVHVIERYVDENTEWNYGDRGSFTVGSKWTIIVWAVDGFCPSGWAVEAKTQKDRMKHGRFQRSRDNEVGFLAIN